MAQNPPVVGVMGPDTLVVGSGENYLIIPGIDDGESVINQTLSVSAISSNTGIVEIQGVDYVSGDKVAIVRVREKNTLGTVTVTVTVTDPDGSVEGTKRVTVAPVNNPGIKFEIHDIVFWQEAIPLTGTPVYSRVLLSQARIQSADLNFDSIPITVNLDCTAKPPCTGYDFYTQLYRGYLTVPTSGNYTFYMEGNDRKSLWLSPNSNVASAVPIIYNGSNRAQVGTDIGGGQWRSAPQALTAGTVYAIYATNWVIHQHGSGILFEGPGISKRYIPAANLMPTYSLAKPGAPGSLTVVARGTNFLRIRWRPSTTSGPAKTYHVYVNGARRISTADTAATITGLSPYATYSVFVVGEDQLGKVSFPSNIATATTHGVDTTPPTAPTSVRAVTISDLAVLVSWSGATDGETEVTSYNVYLDNVKKNATPLFDTAFVFSVLVPSTNYSIQVEAVDAGGNVSPRSPAMAVTTQAFDPANPELGVKKAAVTFTAEAIADACGFGINADYLNGDVFSANTQSLLAQLRPNLVRWGALDANPLNFSAYSGPSKPVTYAKFLNMCNTIGAYCAITTGVKDGTDWRTNPQTFANFIEYINGPATTTYGALRAAEGYPQPLMANSKGLLIELGNEVWGAAAHNAEIGSDYAAYGAWCRQVARIMKASPYYDKSKMWIIYSGRNPHPVDSYGLDFAVARGDTGEVDMISLSGYLGGNLNYDPEIAPGKSEADYYRDGYKRMQRNLEGLVHHHTWYMTNIRRYLPSFFYESNMTTTSYNGRLGQAITMVDYMAAAIERGSVLPSIFHLTGGQWKIVRVAENNRKLPLFVGASYYNRLCRGVALRGSIRTLGRLVDANGAVFTMDPVGFYLYNNGSSFTVMLTSRDFSSDYTVQLNLPPAINAGTVAKKYVLSGSDFSTIDTDIDSSDITLTSGMLVTVPKHSLVFIRFSGTGVSANLPLGYWAGTATGTQPGTPAVPLLKQRSTAPVELFDLRGRRVTVTGPAVLRALSLPPGMYVSRQAGIIEKRPQGLSGR